MLSLKAGEWQAEVYPQYGMNLTALSYAGRPIFRSPADEPTLRENLYLYGNPLLMPANRTKDGRFTFCGKVYELPINESARGNNLHGMMADASFEVIKKTSNEVCAIYRNRGERYPFAFDVTITDVIQGGWRRTVTLQALEDMPYTLAFHSTFAEPSGFVVPRGERIVCDENYIPTGQTVAPEPLGKVISGFYRSVGPTVAVGEYLFTVSDNFDHWILYNGGGEQDFLCIEPQCGGVNGLNNGECRVLKAGEGEMFTLTLERKG